MFASNRSMDSLGAGITSLLRPQNPSSSSSYSHIPPSSSTFARNPPNSSSNQCSAFDRTSFGSYSTAVDQVPSIGVNPTTNNNLSASPPNPRPADPEPSVTQTRLNESQSESVTATPVIGGDTLADVPANKKPAISRPSEEEEVVLHLQSETSGCPSPSMSFYSAVPYTEAKQSFTNTEEASDRASSVGKSIESSEVSNSCDLTEFRKTASHYRASTGSDLSDESSTSSMSSSAMYKPHRANNDVRSEAVRAVRSRDGALGLNHFRVLTKVGGGDIGKVYLSELTGTRTYFAMKVMDKGDLESRKKLVRAQTEREILQALDHPFLPTLYTHFDTERFSCLVMEFCPGGDLHAMRQRRPGKYFSEHAARFYVAEVLLALEYLHMLGIVYRDLKPENVLVREDGHIMLSDFDLSLRCAVSPTIIRSSNSTPLDPKNSSSYCIEPACMIQPDCMTPACFSPRFFSPKSKKSKKKRLKAKAEIHQQVTLLPELVAEPTSARSMSFVGTHEYLAPEIIKGEGHGSAVDWWTFGIFLYELLFGRTPFCGPDNRSTLFNVVGQPLRFPETPAVSFAARDLIRGLLVKEPQHRLAYRRGATEIKQHPFFQSVNWALIRCATPPQVPQPFAYDLAAAKAAALPPSGSNGMTTTTSKQPEQTTVQDMKPSGNYYEIDFF